MTHFQSIQAFSKRIKVAGDVSPILLVYVAYRTDSYNFWSTKDMFSENKAHFAYIERIT